MNVELLSNLSQIKNTASDNFKVIINYFDQGTPSQIKGWINQDEFEFATANNWTTLYQSVGGGSLETLNNLMSAVAEESFRTTGMYKKVWAGVDDTIEMKLKMFLQAEDNAELEVWNPMWTLYSMCLPPGKEIENRTMNKILSDLNKSIEDGRKNNLPGILTGFAQTIVNSAKTIFNPVMLKSPGGMHSRFTLNNIKIGNMLTLNNVKLKNITITPTLTSPTYGGINIDPNDPTKIQYKTYPLYATVELTIMTNTVWTEDSIIGDNGIMKTNIINDGDISSGNAIIQKQEKQKATQASLAAHSGGAGYRQ